MPSLTRRRVLRVAASAGTVGVGGCLSIGPSEPTYRLTARPVGESLADAFRWEPRGRFADADRSLMDRLVAQGSLTTDGFVLPAVGPDERRYVERDGTYYEISVVGTREVEREHWILWFDLVDGDPPADATVFSSSLGLGRQTDLQAEYGLSDLDVHAVDDAVGEIPTEFEFRDLEDEPPGRRGHVFLRRTADETDLVPDPPFTHVVFETGDGKLYARAVVERASVTLRQYEYAAVPVADSATGYVEYVDDTYHRTTFDRETLTDAERRLLDDVTSGVLYEERPPLSDAMAAVLDRLGLGDVETPAPGRVTFSDDVYFSYGNAPFSAQLEILR